ncbi:hypothetical protein HN51_021989 [Arachis hypogaea]
MTSSLDSTNTSATINTSTTSINYTTPNSSVTGVNSSKLLWIQWNLELVDMTEYRMSLSREVEAHFKLKCDRSCNAFVLDDNDSSSSGVQSSRSWLIERISGDIPRHRRGYGEKCELGRARLLAEDGVHKGDEERGERSEDDEGVNIGVAEEVGVGEDGEEEDECGREEMLGSVDSEGIVVEEP